MNDSAFSVNGRTYAPPPCPVVAVCLDGSADEYLDAALARGLMPRLQAMTARGWRGFARAAMPTFTNVNNTSIVTGVPPSVHGISGNYFLDPSTGQEVMMNSASFLRAPTLFPAAAQAGRKVAVVTAKEKLRDIFSAGLVQPLTRPAATLSPSDGERAGVRGFTVQASHEAVSGLPGVSGREEAAGRMPAPPVGIAFSSEKARDARLETHGIDDVESLVGSTPEIYSGDASLYVLKAGARLLETGRADFLYLSTTDYMQHRHAPDEPEALAFYGKLDGQLGRLLDLGAVVGLTADHGMNAKQAADGSPNVVYLETDLSRAFDAEFRVILPITDPYVAHHGALGSFAWVHLPEGFEPGRVARWLCEHPGVTEVLGRAAAARKLELPADRIGDLAVLAGRDVVLGRTPEHHDLSSLHGGLRSHGGRYEEMVPFVFSHPLKPAYRARAMADVRNFDLFDFTCNGTQL